MKRIPRHIIVRLESTTKLTHHCASRSAVLRAWHPLLPDGSMLSTWIQGLWHPIRRIAVHGTEQRWERIA